MALAYSLLDVFADSPFQGIQIPVVLLNGHTLSDAHKQAIASEFQQTETVFIDTADKAEPASVYNSKGPCLFGAHTILAASYMAYEKGLVKDQGSYSAEILPLLMLAAFWGAFLLAYVPPLWFRVLSLSLSSWWVVMPRASISNRQSARG